MPRSNASARAAGSSFERLIADGFKALGHKFADRMVKRGTKDAGDIANVFFVDSAGETHPVCLELENTTRQDLPKWIGELNNEMVNLGTQYGAVIHKRHGKGKAEDQWVTMDLRMFNRFITGKVEA